MILEYSKTNYRDNQYQVTGEPGNWDKSCWFVGAKPLLLPKNPLLNLPYVLDGDVLVTQSNACLKYLGRKLNLNGDETKNN
mmetsp:Transcript_373/g.530  ORF Transcript_373/g.530 Transcript_373/m.530 type:complete len:81 (+) Transcript_373:71-313(+)